MTFNVSQVMGTFSLWIQHRIADHLKSKSDKTIPISECQKYNDSNQNHEDKVQAQSTDEDLTEGIDDTLINVAEAQTKHFLKAFVLSIPVISQSNKLTSMIQHSDDSWNLFVKLNIVNLLQWIMSNPLYCDDTEVFDLLCEHGDISISTITRWKNNLPELIADMNSSESSQGTKAKDYTLLAFFTRSAHNRRTQKSATTQETERDVKKKKQQHPCRCVHIVPSRLSDSKRNASHR